MLIRKKNKSYIFIVFQVSVRVVSPLTKWRIMHLKMYLGQQENAV
jgi:hypothetical protein